MKVRYFKSLLKRFLPGFIVKYVIGVKMLHYQNKKYWSGVYQRFEDVPTKGTGYFEETLTKETKEYTKFLMDSLNEEVHLPYSLPEENTFLPLISSLILSNQNELKVLELGGGMGIGYLSMKACLSSKVDLKYTIIETPLTCKQGRELFKNNYEIQFFSDFPRDANNVDVVFVKSALQYFKDYNEILRKLTDYSPRYVLLVKLSAGENLTYVSAQRNLPGTIAAFWFLNISEVMEIMASLGYTLIFKGVLDREYNQNNFPAQYRLRKNSNLLFKKTN